MTDGLQKLFGSAARIKLLRLFLFNPKQSFTLADAAQRANVSDKEARYELTTFFTIGLISKSRRAAKEAQYCLNHNFSHVIALQDLLLNAPARSSDIYARLRPAGVLKFIALSGVFTGEWSGRLDILIVGDKIKASVLRKHIHQLESEIGKELRYALLTSEDFLYRVNMNDKLVRDVLDYPHKVVLNKFAGALKFK